jgi:hypothetical protein
MRWLAVSILVAVHLALVVLGDALPAVVVPAVAGTVYLPLWLLSAAGLPVFAPAASGGWASPSTLGWLIVIAIWSLLWTAVVAAVVRLRR